jgi:AcrR family transcriptional regulator
MVGDARPGGRTARTRAVVLEATLAELTEQGYDAMSVESVATRAGVHKTTVYRRWISKEGLVTAALKSAADVTIGAPDTGAVERDLRALAHAVQRALARTDGAAAVLALVTGVRASPEVARVARRFWAARMEQVGPIVRRAVARGELPSDTNPAAVIEHLVAPLYHRLLIGGAAPAPHEADTAAAATLAAVRAGVFRSDAAAPGPEAAAP